MSQGKSLGWVYCAACAVLLLPAIGTTRAAVLLGLNDSNTGELYRITVDDVSKTIASMTLIANVGQPLATIERAPDGTIYGYTRGTTPELYRLNSTTYLAEKVAAITPSSPIQSFFLFEGALTFTPDGIAYGTNLVDSWVNRLYTIDLATGVLTQGAALDYPAHDINGMVWHNGYLFGVDQMKKAILKIDPLTGNTFKFCDLNTTALYANGGKGLGGIGGMTVIGNIGYFSSASKGETTAQSGTNELYSVNLDDGTLQYLGVLTATADSKGIGALAVPEPTTLALLGLGCAAIRPRRRR